MGFFSRKGDQKPDIVFENTPFERTVIPYSELIKDVKPTKRGLYPPEVVTLFFCNKYPTDRYPQYWWFKYGIKDMPAVVKSLEKRGFIELVDGAYRRTKLGDDEMKDNEQIVYAHRKPNIVEPLDAWTITEALDGVELGFKAGWRDKLWGYLNRLPLDRSSQYKKALFLAEEKRYRDVVSLLEEVIRLDELEGYKPAPGIVSQVNKFKKLAR